MINLRMLALASALLLFLPVAAWAMPTDERVVEGGVEGVLRVDEIELVDLGDRHNVLPNSTFGQEQLVEGHTTFATIDIKTEVVNATGSVTVEALVNCTVKGGFDYKYDPVFGLIPYPTTVHPSMADCLAHAVVTMIPDPVPASSSSFSPLRPTGVVERIASPLGDVGYLEEFQYTETWTGFDGVEHSATRYAWSVPVFDAWIEPDGDVRNVVVPMPADRLNEMGLHDFHLVDSRGLHYASQ